MVHAVVLAGVVAVMPLVFGGWRRWAVAGAAVVTSFLLPVGAASAAAASVWLMVALWVVVPWTATRCSRISMDRPITMNRAISAELAPIVAALFAAAFAVVAASAFVQSRAGMSLFGIGEPIVELTAVHFSYAGVGAVTLAGVVAVDRVGRLGLLATVAAPPLVAIGFVVSHPLPQVGGAVLMSAGVLTTAALQLREVAVGAAARRVLLTLSGLAPWVPMALAVAWATSMYWDVPALSVPDMARTHGVMNVVFVVAGLLARRAVLEGSNPGSAPTGPTRVIEVQP
jgi:hypothetical protein